MVPSKHIKRFCEIFFEFCITFVCFFALYFPLKDFAPYSKIFSKLNDDYIYTLNVDYSSFFQEQSDVALYHFEYDGESCTLYTNWQGVKYGICILDQSPFLGFYKFDIKSSNELITNYRYNLEEENIFVNKSFVTGIGSVRLNADFLIVDEHIEDSFQCEYKIYPPMESSLIYDQVTLNNGSFSARGKTIKESVYSSTNSIGLLLMLIAIIPSIVLVFGLSFFYSLQIERKNEIIFISYLFYKKKSKIVIEMFLKFFSKNLLLALICAITNYLIFISNDLVLLFVPLLTFALFELTYLFLFTKIRIGFLLREGVDIKYEN